DDTHHAAVRGERGFEDIAVRQVAAPAVEPDRGLKLKRPAAAGVEHGRKNARGIKIRQAQPIDRSIASDKRGRPAVADQRVILDRRVAVMTHEVGKDAKSRPGWTTIRWMCA